MKITYMHIYFSENWQGFVFKKGAELRSRGVSLL